MLKYLTMTCRFIISTLVATIPLIGLAQPENVSTKQVLKHEYSSISGAFTGKKVAESPDPLVSYRWDDPKVGDNLEIYTISPKEIHLDKKGAAKWSGKAGCPIIITDPCSLRFDFGQVNAGWLEIDSDDMNGDVEFSISEFNEPAVFNVGSQHPAKTYKPTKYNNTYRLELNRELFEGVRYGWIHVHSLEKPINIKEVRLVCQIRPTNYNGSFSCDDPKLTRIWYTGAYTVKLNLFEDYFGAILMERSDRQSWTGDAHPSQAAALAAFGNFDFVRENIMYTSKQSNGIASYALYWVLSLIDYYNYTGDNDTVDILLDNACGKLDLAYEKYGSDMKLRFFGWDERLGAGFENPDCNENKLTYKMLSIRVWSEFARCMKQYGREDLAKKYGEYANEKMADIRKDPQWYNSSKLFSASDAVTTGLTSSKENEALWDIAFSDRLHRVSYSPFNQYFVIQAMSKMNRYDEALATINDQWGGQIEYGATTFFEVFLPSWNSYKLDINDAPVNNQCGYTSMTHPWSSGVTKWLSEEILGIKPTTPGFKTFDVIPHLGTTLKSVKGTTPTPEGLIAFAIDTKEGAGMINVPNNTKARLAIPKMGRGIENVTFKGMNITKDSEDSEFIYYNNLNSGNYEFEIKYSGKKQKTSKLAPIEYKYKKPATFDHKTQGDWIGTYGSKGYVLFNHSVQGENISKESDIVEIKAFNLNIDKNLTSSSEDPRALISPDRGNRALGAFITGDPKPTHQTITIDLDLKKRGETYQVALYLVDWDRGSRRSALEILDLDNQKILAPVTMIRDYKEGVYVVLQLDQSVRLRYNQVRGENVSINAIFFD